jgi:hypothetical protein
MRDIREDLTERLHALAAEKAKLQGRIDVIAAHESIAQAMLQNEEDRIARLTVPRAELPFPAEQYGVSPLLGTLIKRVLTVKNRPLTMEEIRDEILRMSNFDFGEKKPGRSIHFGLVSLMNGGEVEKLRDGRWTLVAHQNGQVPVQEAQHAH